MDLYCNGIVLCQQTRYSVIIWVWACADTEDRVLTSKWLEVWPTEVGHASDQDPSPILDETDTVQYGDLTDHTGIHVALLKSLDSPPTRKVYRWDQQCCQV